MTTRSPADAPSPAHRAIAVVIVNYQTATLVLDGLPALIAELQPYQGSHIFIVDNASPNGDVELFRTALAGHDLGRYVSLIASPSNGGFAAGNNAAFARIRTLRIRFDYVFLLNPDARVTPGALSALVGLLEREPSAALVGPRIVGADGRPHTSAFNFPSILREFSGAAGLSVFDRFWPLCHGEAGAAHSTDWIPGAAVLMRAHVLDDIGDMDDGYFLYFEEIDYMRAARLRGLLTWREPAATVIHIAGASTGMIDGRHKSGRVPDYWFHSWARYFMKNHGALYTRLAALGRLTGMIVGLVQRRIRGRQSNVPDGFLQNFAKSCLLFPGRSLPVHSLRMSRARGRV